MSDEHKRGFFRTVGAVSGYLFDTTIDGLGEKIHIIWREFELFLGSTLILLGLLSFKADKFCDGNTADYLSCTRPSAFYYFPALDKGLIILGVILVLVWVVKRK